MEEEMSLAATEPKASEDGPMVTVVQFAAVTLKVKVFSTKARLFCESVTSWAWVRLFWGRKVVVVAYQTPPLCTIRRSVNTPALAFVLVIHVIVEEAILME